MKASNVVIVILLATVGYLSYSLYFTEEDKYSNCSCEELERVKQVLNGYMNLLIASEEQIDKGNFKVNLSPDQGTRFTNQQSRAKMNAFISWNRRNAPQGREYKINPYGFGFGLKKVNAFMKLINDYNSDSSNNSDEFVGIRVYLTKKDTSDNPRPHIDNLDILMVPVLKNGGDPINNNGNKFMDTDTARWGLNTSLPCPKNCQ